MKRETLFNRTLAEQKPNVWAYIVGKTPTKEDAEDILQTSLLAFAMALNHAREEIENPAGLLMTIAKRRIADFHKKREQEPRTEEINDFSPKTYQHGDSKTNFFLWLDQHKLSDLERELLARKYVEEQTYKVMSPILKKSEKALQNVFSRVLKKLKARYDRGRKK